MFDELELWRVSEYSTWQVELSVPDEPSLDALIDLCNSRKLGIEDWSSVRMICAECSRGNPGPHECGSAFPESGSAFAFGVKTKDDIAEVLQQWRAQFPEAEYGEIELLLPAKQ